MTVKELIVELGKLNPNAEVEIYCTFDAGFGTAGGSKIEIIDNSTSIELFNDEC